LGKRLGNFHIYILVKKLGFPLNFGLPNLRKSIPILIGARKGFFFGLAGWVLVLELNKQEINQLTSFFGPLRLVEHYWFGSQKDWPQ